MEPRSSFTSVFVRRVFAWLQFDKSLSFALIARIWQAFSGPITIALQIRGLDLPETGIYLTLLSIVAVQPLFELGLASVLIGQASSIAAKINLGKDRHNSKAELHWLAQAACRWFTGVAVLYAIGALLLGWNVLGGSGTAILDWRVPLVLTILLATVSFAVSPRAYIMEGAGERDFVYRIRLVQAIVGSLVAWLSLYFGFKLWAIVAIFLVNAVFSLFVAFGGRARRLFAFAGTDNHRIRESWISKIGPFQWRVASISAAHYLASQLMLIHVMKYHGETAAAPLGMTLQITTAIQSLALAWAQTKFSLISQHQASNQREYAGTLWRQTALVSSGLLVLALTVLSILVSCLPWFGRGWERSFLSMPLIALLSIGLLANHILSLQSYYVLSRGAKPLVGVTLIGLLATALAVWWGGKEYSTSGVIFAYSVGMGVVAVPLHTWAYLRFRAH